MGASRRFRRRVRRRRFAGSPAELSAGGRVLTPAEREDSLAVAELVADDAAEAGCTCDHPEVIVLEGAAGSVFTPGRLTQTAVAHEHGCPLRTGGRDETMARMATIDSILNNEGDAA